jgi:hypothetical protein
MVELSQNFKEARKLAKEFILLVGEYEKEISKLDSTIWPSIHRAAAKRKSMDLTRALAKIRRTNQWHSKI